MSRRGRHCSAAVLAIVGSVAAGPAMADGLTITDGSPRAIGRAGTGTVADDGGGALLVNPAAMARRTVRRVQVGLAAIDDALTWTASPTAVRERDQAGSRLAPTIAMIGAVGDFVVGVAAMTSAVAARELPRPGGRSPDSLDGAFGARYAGYVGRLRRDTFTLGAARRLGDSVAVGLSLAGSRVAVVEERDVWAGSTTRETPGDPHQDVDLTLSAHDSFVPGAVVGIMIAPPTTHLELGASLAWSATAHARGTDETSSAQLDVPQPWTLRAGARWLGEHWAAELDGDLWLFGASAAEMRWTIARLGVRDPSSMADTAATTLSALPSRLSAQTRGAVRGSVELELIDGLLWATGGYAYTTAGTAAARLSPTFGGLSGHTGAVGIEGTSGGFTLTIGWSRTWEVARSAASVWSLDNPFGPAAGTAAISAGRYSGSIDQLGVLLDIEVGGE